MEDIGGGRRPPNRGGEGRGVGGSAPTSFESFTYSIHILTSETTVPIIR